MKKRAALLGTGLAAGAICAAMAMNVFAAQITADRAKEIALENAGVKEDQVAYIGAELDYDDGKQVYDVEFFTADYKEYDYEINATTGEVISMDYDAERSYHYDGSKAVSGTQAAITSEEAKTKALEHSGISADQVPFINVKLDYDDGRQIYEVEFYTDSYKEYDYEIDASTGEVISWDYDAERFRQREETKTGNKTAETAAQSGLTVDEVKAEALKIAGLADSQVTWGRISQDYDDGRMVYEGKFVFETSEYEFELDANTGNVIDWDVESIYD